MCVIVCFFSGSSCVDVFTYFWDFLQGFAGLFLQFLSCSDSWWFSTGVIDVFPWFSAGFMVVFWLFHS